ncbi:UDP-N-acetylglucosamine 1-carboxyvinyltransferase [Capnocytophaga cynodegmi]|uniref:UDP-N-acetylglucosamine 1-carboxyvinyltransferase n=1 Tax=Capnocytophaga cynodegmi TaxID=28189 RepID=A0A0B7H4L0_9FLAO|nr:UDP-N-acetylglucosamine 1-carboxyvinyltransferase [Capnocytophaga cynodegmi]GIM53606.1 UDP-N-acetylglucosamine 1-carboxyvinyltransferase [Capnocytophaga cynodegmi]CEN32847.1 UDP-N-acetylglucosamine 1-carboxyvinyltransferase [Capnocytophaga cynodegmi]
MGVFKIEGGHTLKGEITPQGAKNEALQVLCAVLLTNEKVTIHNIPNILDVNKLISLLENLGVKIQKLGKGSYSFQADEVNLEYLKSEAFQSEGQGLRGSIMIVGPLLTRFGVGYIPRPGGDKIGRRRLDTHFEGFIKLGANFNYDKENQTYSVTSNRLKGADMLLDEASVTGTSNIIMAAVLAEGTTTIYNAACEPYVQQLCRMLNIMGADIQGIGSNFLTINGVEKLSGCTHTLLPDMIEIGSWIGLAAMTQSEITIKNVGWEHLGLIPNVFQKLGITLERRGDDIYIPAHTQGYEVQNYIDGSILTVSDAPWPGFTPDLLSIILVMATQARGEVLIHQKMFESRLFFIDKLIDMGAKIILCDPHRATVIGNDFKSPLKATLMTSPDIRAGIALLIAALSAKGTSTIYNIEQIDRGYENIDERLRALGARIIRVN